MNEHRSRRRGAGALLALALTAGVLTTQSVSAAAVAEGVRAARAPGSAQVTQTLPPWFFQLLRLLLGLLGSPPSKVSTTSSSTTSSSSTSSSTSTSTTSTSTSTTSSTMPPTSVPDSQGRTVFQMQGCEAPGSAVLTQSPSSAAPGERVSFTLTKLSVNPRQSRFDVNSTAISIPIPDEFEAVEVITSEPLSRKPDRDGKIFISMKGFAAPYFPTITVTAKLKANLPVGNEVVWPATFEVSTLEISPDTGYPYGGWCTGLDTNPPLARFDVS